MPTHDFRSLVDQAVSSVPVVGDFWDAGKFFANIIGVSPRGDLQKFARVMYPYMGPKASSTGVPVYTSWWGEIVRVSPAGETDVITRFDTNSYNQSTGLFDQAEVIYLNEAEKVGQLFVVRCTPNIPRDTVADVQRGCYFELIEGPGFLDRLKDFIPGFSGVSDGEADPAGSDAVGQTVILDPKIAGIALAAGLALVVALAAGGNPGGTS